MTTRKSLEDVIREQGELAASLRAEREKSEADALALATDAKEEAHRRERELEKALEAACGILDSVVEDTRRALAEATLDPHVEPDLGTYEALGVAIRGIKRLSYINASSAADDRPERVLIRFGWGPRLQSKDSNDPALWIVGNFRGSSDPQFISFAKLDAPTISWAIQTNVARYGK